MGAMFVLFGAYFLYDGNVGYPKQVEIAKKKEWFDKEFLATFDEAKGAGTLEQWMADAGAKGLPTGIDGEAPGGWLCQADAVRGAAGEAEKGIGGRAAWEAFVRELGDAAAIEVSGLSE